MKNIFYAIICLMLLATNVRADAKVVSFDLTPSTCTITLSTVADVVDKYPTGLSLEIAKHTTPKLLYDFRYHDTLAGADFSLASYKVLVLNGGWASSVDRSNSRGVVLAGLTVELQRSKYVRDFTSAIFPKLDYGIFNNLGIGGFAGWDFDVNQYRYGVYMGLVFDSISSLFKGKSE